MVRDKEIELLQEGVETMYLERGCGRSQIEMQLEEEVPVRRPLGSTQTLPTKRTLPALPRPKSTKVATIRTTKPPPRPSGLPPFDHRCFKPSSRPGVVYTTSADEADDLLACLRGPVLGFDIEWPVSGKYRTVGPDGKVVEKRVGMRWNGAAAAWEFEQCRTALVQLCDEKLVVLVHLRDMDGTALLPLESTGK